MPAVDKFIEWWYDDRRELPWVVRYGGKVWRPFRTKEKMLKEIEYMKLILQAYDARTKD